MVYVKEHFRNVIRKTLNL